VDLIFKAEWLANTGWPYWSKKQENSSKFGHFTVQYIFIFISKITGQHK